MNGEWEGARAFMSPPARKARTQSERSPALRERIRNIPGVDLTRASCLESLV